MRFLTLIYFRYTPLTVKVFQDFYMQAVLDVGINIEYWDLSPLFFPNITGQEDSSYLLGHRVIKLESYAEIEQRIQQQQLSSTLFLSIVTYNHLVIRLFRLLTDYKCTLGVFGRNMCPTTSLSASNFVHKLFGITWNKIRNRWYNRLALRLKTNGTIRKYDIIFQGGTKGYKGVGIGLNEELQQANVIEVNSDDYDRYLLLRNAPRAIKTEYILFLDEYLPLHPDTVLFKIKNTDPDKYYAELNAYFDRIEAKFGLPVVVAAHPKAIQYKEVNYFYGRRVEFGLTGLLVRDARFVLAHNSTAISYVIAFGRPLHLITSHMIEQKLYSVHQHVVVLSDYLNCNWQYMDDNGPIEIADISLQRYEQYKYDFLCSSQTKCTTTETIFINYLLM